MSSRRGINSLHLTTPYWDDSQMPPVVVPDASNTIPIIVKMPHGGQCRSHFFLCAGCGLGEGRCALVQAIRRPESLRLIKLDGLNRFFLENLFALFCALYFFAPLSARIHFFGRTRICARNSCAQAADFVRVATLSRESQHLQLNLD